MTQRKSDSCPYFVFLCVSSAPLRLCGKVFDFYVTPGGRKAIPRKRAEIVK
jgi:hypothetical protein